MPHICLVTHTVAPGDGQGRVNYEVVRAALDRGDHVTVLSSSIDEDLLADSNLDWVRISVSGWPSTLLRNQVFALRSANWLRQHRHRMDVILANGCITWEPADLNVAHFVHSAWMKSSVHTWRLKSGPWAWYQALYTWINAKWEKKAFNQAASVIAVSDRIAEEIADLNLSETRIQTILNGVDLTEFSPGEPDRNVFGLPVDQPVAVFIGDLQTPRKNLDTVLSAIRHVPDVHLAVAGSTDGSPYPQMARELGLSDRVHFLGFQNDIPLLLRSADVCVCPSRYEPFSLVLLEALASGCPVVTAQPVGAAPILTEICGTVVDDPEDTCSIAAAIERFVRSTNRSDIQREARRVAEQYSWKRTAMKYLKTIDAFAGGSNTAITPDDSRELSDALHTLPNHTITADEKCLSRR